MRLFLLAPLLLLAACGSNEESYTVQTGDGKDAKVTVNDASGSTTIESADGTAVVSEGGKGANFPAYAPRYPGATVTASVNFNKSGADGGSGQMITQQTKDAPDKVLEFYQSSIEKSGRKISMQSKTASGGLLIVAPEEGENDASMMISVSRVGNNETTITYTAGQ